MKRLGLGIGVLLLSLGVSFAAQKPKLQTFNGEIMDNMCAMMGGHSKMALKGESDRDCTLRCVKLGGKFVLFNKKTKTMYLLDNQKMPVSFAGERVRVTGDYNTATKTIHVVKIQAAS
jgi:hypothetical protein